MQLFRRTNALIDQIITEHAPREPSGEMLDLRLRIGKAVAHADRIIAAEYGKREDDRDWQVIDVLLELRGCLVPPLNGPQLYRGVAHVPGGNNA